LHLSPLLVEPWRSLLNWFDLEGLLAIFCCMSIRKWYKSPFEKWGYRGFSRGYKNSPCPRFRKGGGKKPAFLMAP
jgi:hypothetical protein